MAVNPNDFCGEPMYSEDVCNLMRRINQLEAAYDLLIESSGGGFQCQGGLRGYVLTVMTESSKEIYICREKDGNDDVQVFADSDGTLDRTWSIEDYRTIMGIAHIGTEFYLACFYNVSSPVPGSTNVINVCNGAGTIIRSFDGLGTLSGGDDIWSLLGYNNELYLGTERARGIRVYNTSGVFQRTIGNGNGSGDGEFQFAVQGLAELGGEIYASDSGNDRIQVFDPDGTYKRQWATPSGLSANALYSYNGYIYASLIVDSTTSKMNLYVYDSVGNVIQKYLKKEDDSDWDLYIPYVDSAGGMYGTVRKDDLTSDAYRYALPSQTIFQAYQEATDSDFIPDTGDEEPVDNSLCPTDPGPYQDADGVFARGADFVSEHITDMRTAIEALAPLFVNADTGNPFNWTPASSDNLYFKAMGNRTKYGATGGSEYDWTRTFQLEGDRLRDIDIGEIEECVTLLEASDLVAEPEE
jgi:hypothetical protein